jgi:recombination associated protein RdgC
MWFKQIQLFQLTSPVQSSANSLAERLEPLAYKPCLPTMPTSMGWVSPIEDDEVLARGINGCIMICLQIEEKILPASVVGQTLKDKIKEIEVNEARKVRKNEKLNFKDEIIHTLLPRAFSKYTRIPAYIDTRNGWLVLNTTSPAKTELFISLLKKSLGDIIEPFEVIKPAAILTQWLKSQAYPKEFSIEKSCVLQDPNQQNRVIRCQEQDLFAGSIQSLVKDGCEAIQVALCWQDRINFVLSDNFMLRSVRLADEDITELKEDVETKQQRFDADFVLMSEMFTGMILDVLNVFEEKENPPLAKAG